MKMKRIAACVLCLVMVFVFASCSGGNGKVLATVNGEKIYQNDVEGFAAVMALMSSMNYADLDAGTKAQIDNSMLVRFINVEAMKTYLDKEGADVITDDIKKQIDENADNILSSVKEQEPDAEKLHITKELLVYILEGEQYDSAYRAKIAEDNPVSDEDVEAYYNENLELYTREAEERQVSHILMGTKEHTDEERAAAQAVLDRALAGEDFAALATENSTDTGSASQGGDVGNVKQDGSMVAPFEEAVFALGAPGDISGLVESDYGFHIIKLVNILAPGQKTLDEVSADIKSTLEQERFSEASAKLVKEAKIEYAKDIKVDKETNLPLPAEVETGSND